MLLEAKFVGQPKGDGGSGLFCIKPGRRKVAGEILLVMRIPLQLAVRTATTATKIICLRMRSAFMLPSIK
jgi:hypothetical protein